MTLACPRPTEVTAMASNPDHPDQWPRDTPTEAHKLTAEEAMDLLRGSGGYAVLRYDCGRDHIDYRYNPATGEFEQAHVTVDGDGSGDDPIVDTYRRVPESTLYGLLTEPHERKLLPPQLVAYPQSHFPNISEWPDEPYPHEQDD